jgi:hypothetical protein
MVQVTEIACWTLGVIDCCRNANFRCTVYHFAALFCNTLSEKPANYWEILFGTLCALGRVMREQ